MVCFHRVLEDQFGLVDMFGRLLVRQSAHAVLATNWNVVEYSEELAQNFANVLANAHIAFRAFEIQREQRWRRKQRKKAELSNSYPGPGIEVCSLRGFLQFSTHLGLVRSLPLVHLRR